MSSLLYDYMELILTSCLDHIPDCGYKKTGFSKAVIEDGFELFSSDRFSGCTLDYLLILLLTIQELIV